MKNSIQFGQTVIVYDLSDYQLNESTNNSLTQFDIIKNSDSSLVCSVYNSAIVWGIDISTLTITNSNNLTYIQL